LNKSIPSWVGAMNALGTAKTPFFFLISFDMQSSIVQPLSMLDENISYKINEFRHESSNTKKPDKLTHFKSYPVLIDQYKEGFDKVMNRILYGDSYLVNLTIPTPITCNLSLQDIYATAHAKYKLLLKDKLVVFSPECFIKIIDNAIYSFPMKGTIDAALPNAADTLLNDDKEISEHYTIVDLIRNDLSIVARDVKVTKFRFIDRIHTNEKELLQTSSEICGLLSDDYHCRLGDLFHSLLPAGSISGAPKNATLDIISKSEYDSRGFYTGVFGIYDGHNLDSGVAIRYIESLDGQLIYRSGGGITAMSTVESEYTESINKVYVPIGRKHMD
jgi:para-aminobenzoate synthetase component I